MVRVDYDPIFGCVGWDFRQPNEDLSKYVQGLNQKLNKLKRRPKNVSNINYIKK